MQIFIEKVHRKTLSTVTSGNKDLVMNRKSYAQEQSLNSTFYLRSVVYLNFL